VIGFLDHPPPVVFAHRGGAALWPENTLRSFQGALDLGVRYLETDVHTTRDEVIVCFHDATVDRTTDGTGRVRDKTLDELRRLDAGYRFSPDGRSYPFRGRGDTVPTFEEALALHPEARFNVEIKQREPDMVARLFRFIEERELHDRVLVAAADDRVGDAFRAVARGRVRTSAGIRGVQAFWAASLTGAHRFMRFDFDALQVPPCHPTRPWLRVVTRRFVEAAHHHGIRVHVWTIDDPDEIRRLCALGVDGIMSDRPDVLVDVVREV
jgi:glycerophosphoryl diester phosphodiesterase